MAQFNWNVYSNTPAWHDMSTNTIVFSGSATDLTAAITVASWQSGTHLGSGDPGTDQCGGSTHMPNCKFVSSTQFDTGAGTETLGDATLAETECQLQIVFTDASSVVTTSGRFYAYDGTTTTTEATGVECYAFERGVSATTWTLINDDSNNTGGDNTGERLAISDDTTATEHTFYIAVSASPESVGGKVDFDLGVSLTYS